MDKRRLLKIGAIILFTGVIIAGVIGYDKYIAQSSKNSDLYFETKNEVKKVHVPTAREIRKTNILKELRELLAQTAPTADQTDVEVQVKESAWIPEWLYIEGFASLKLHSELIDIIMPVWFNIDEAGNLIEKKPSDESVFINYAHSENILVLPSIAVFDADLVKGALSDENRQKHISQIVQQVVANNYDGIDLDYESTYEEDAENYKDFLATLSAELHKEDKLLSVTVISQWGEDISYPSLPQTRKVQDWAMINDYADQVRIMTYDYTTASSSEPGPIGPYDWQIEVLDYATQKMDPEKIWLGVHLYAYEWDSEGNSNTYKYQTLLDVLPQEAELIYNQIVREGIATYPCNNGLTCTTYYQTQQGVEDRRKLAQAYGIAGVAYWMLGDEVDLLDYKAP